MKKTRTPQENRDYRLGEETILSLRYNLAQCGAEGSAEMERRIAQWMIAHSEVNKAQVEGMLHRLGAEYETDSAGRARLVAKA